MNIFTLFTLAALLLLAIVQHFGVDAGEKGDKIILGVGKGHKGHHGYDHGGYGGHEHGYGHHKKCKPGLIVKKGKGSKGNIIVMNNCKQQHHHEEYHHMPEYHHHEEHHYDGGYE